ncbi:flagellar hook-length control protein FliK [Sulfurimonas sp. SWIR-19]|uniref:flagellar hook-length control protein FliK n=1 Tax=Sulfurimonas sp. SWIR-19 TaxID=2878390 RepID=UPI001CF3A138|nr:flagellar hook-length control protein FliK [Sulfurimonas sp. SWIR-19]UCN00365.1 flagellar hook-length control protein FliK [Sulfurimonas sp. SWIR-19]
MISVDIKKETSSLSPLNTALPKQEKPTISFASLLKGTKESNSKIMQNGSLILALNDEKVSVGSVTDAESSELASQITAKMSQEDVKVLIKEAKEFLKNKIVQSEGYKKAEIDTLPKTLGGLVELAKKTGIELSKITLEEVKDFTQTKAKTITQQKSSPLQIKQEAVQKPDETSFPRIKQEAVQKSEETSFSRIKQEAVQKSEETSFSRIKQESKEEADISNEEVPVRAKVKQTKEEVAKVQETEVADESLELVKKEIVKNRQEVKQEQKQTPLFKAQSSVAEITTQQIVDTKVNTLTIDKTPKQKADDTLKLLLRGEKITKNESGLTADFSVATAKVMVAPPHTSKEAEKSLASLLQNDKSEDGAVQAKTDGLNIAKADSFEVKLNEAKQMVKYLSHDVKSAIEDYKSPFTRIKVQLNPQRLGEVDLTIVQRGKNLHINISSNNTAINTLAMNVQDLKVQLQNNGIQNASLNFNSNAQSENSQAGQQEQQRQNQQKADDEYNYFETLQSNEEVLSSLEIIVPYYA